ncbi:MAG: hypothetical protein IVW55_09875 [Chloroflexi bacterium]|nr:hypothetical protein [Chloroflexota bacterium]
MKQSEVDMERALFAGAVAATAFLATTWVDSQVSSHPYNDLKLVGQFFTTRSPAWIIQGVAGHYTFALLVSLLYARWGYNLLPGPGWLKGLIFLQIENSLIYPGAVIFDKVHAGVRSGQLPPLLSRKSFWGQLLRHVAFGLALGALYKPERDRES